MIACTFAIRVVGEKRRLFEEYTTAGNEVKAMLEKRYGKKQLKILVDDTLAAAWING